MQVRILGCLVEKERTTPDNYPLTMNALLAACNQTTNRWPLVAFTEATVANAIENLRGEGLLRVVHSRSNRADKYRHVLGEAWELGDAEMAVVGVLMLRGAQTVAELRARTERYQAFPGADDVEGALAALASRHEPLVARLERAPGQKEVRWGHLLGGDAAEGPPAPPEQERRPRADRLDAVEGAIADLRADLARLRGDHEALVDRLRALLD